MDRPASPVGKGKVPPCPWRVEGPHSSRLNTGPSRQGEIIKSPSLQTWGICVCPHRQLPQLWERTYGHYTCPQHSGASVLSFMLFIEG